MAVRRMLFSEFNVALTDGKLIAQARGEEIDIGRHQPAVEVKGATFTELRVARANGEWLVQTVVAL